MNETNLHTQMDDGARDRPQVVVRETSYCNCPIPVIKIVRSIVGGTEGSFRYQQLQHGVLGNGAQYSETVTVEPKTSRAGTAGRLQISSFSTSPPRLQPSISQVLHS